ncbi:MAG: GNAT family N-acetyltransferase [Oscillospiraceae bacterium]|nr:GNAT family N-acetyltransferase [Oscillospiraceae bacterium]
MQHIRLVPADEALAEQTAAYYCRNRIFLQEFEPVREEEFFSVPCQQKLLREEALEFREKTAFRSAFLGYKLDERFLNRGYMTEAVGMLVRYAFEDLHLHRIEANVMPKNKASLRVLEKNCFINEGYSRHYLKINGVWEDHIHMVKLNEAMHI